MNCEYCYKYFKQQGHLRQHLKREHKEEYDEIVKHKRVCLMGDTNSTVFYFLMLFEYSYIHS